MASDSASAAIRALRDALDEGVRRPWTYEDGDDYIRTGAGEAVVQVISDEEGRYIRALASPDVATALADLLDAIDALEQTDDHIPLGAAVPLGRVLRTRDALKAAITRSRT